MQNSATFLRNSPRSRGASLGALLLLCGLGAACGDDSRPDGDGAVLDAGPGDGGRDAGPGTDGGRDSGMMGTDGGGDDAGTGSDAGRDGGTTLADGGSTMPPDAGMSASEAWSANAVDLRGMIDETFELPCPGTGESRSIWGTDLYTDDSPVCVAGVHAGAITMEAGGVVTIRIRPGTETYTGSTRHGVASLDWTTMWHGSYEVVVAAPPR